MKRRNRVLLMWMLTSIWLCVQSPWSHAQREQMHAPGTGHAAMPLAAHDPVAPCHGEEPAQPQAPADSAGCCAEGHCDGHCVQLSFAPAAAPPLLIARGVIPFTPMRVAGVQSVRQPELFRPPI
jgi:hypothetical protein